MKQTIEPEIRARTDTEVTTDFFSGHMVPKAPSKMPSEPKLAKPQIAYVVIVKLRS